MDTKARKLAAAASLLVGTCVLTESTPASAWLYNGCRWPGNSVKLKNSAQFRLFSPGSQDYTARAWDAFGTWAGTVTDLNSWSMSVATPSGLYINVFDVQNYNSGYVGLTSWSCSSNVPGPNFFTSVVQSKWNWYYTAYQTAAFNNGIMVHEIGHAIGLGHANCGAKSAPAVMNASVAGSCPVWVPQADDINGVNWVY